MGGDCSIGNEWMYICMCHFFSQLAPPQAESIVEAMHRVKNPHRMCVKLHQKISELLAELREIAKTSPCRESLNVYQLD